ncbi:biopolymer transporter ExbD [bacterium]|nr:biopolymer transporter ExbD [bacterium]
MIPAAKKPDATINSINVTPLVDVCLVLVIIFMVTVPMLFKPLREIIMPKAYTAQSQNKQIIYVTCTRDKLMFLDEEEVNVQALLERLGAKLITSEYKVVIIRADEKLPYDHITQVMAIVKKAGARKIYFATEVKKN